MSHPNDPFITVSSAEAAQLESLSREQGAQQASLSRVPEPVQETDWAAMVPPEHRGNPRAYIEAMVGRSDASNPRAFQSTDIGALPIDARILADVRSPVGFPRSVSEITDDCTVSYMGTRLTVADAVRQGLLEIDANGRYSVPNAAERSQQDQAKEQQARQEHEAGLAEARANGDEPDAATQRVIDNVSARATPQAIGSVVSDYIANGGSISAANLAKAAQASGMTNEEAQHAVLQMVDGLQAQAFAATRAAGVESTAEVFEMWRWAEQSHPVEHANAARNLIMMSDSKGLKQLAKLYLAHKRDASRK